MRVAAHVCARPAATAMTSVNPGTDTGDDLSTVVPSPSCPSSLAPQHQTTPASSSAHAWRPRAAIACTSGGSPTTGVGGCAVTVAAPDPI